MDITSSNYDAPAKTHAERIALIAISEQLRSLSGLVACLADSTNRSEGVYQRTVKNALPDVYRALAALVAEVGGENSSDAPRFSNGVHTETAKAAGGVLVIPNGTPDVAPIERRDIFAVPVAKAEPRKDEIVIERSARGYKFTLPQAPREAVIWALKSPGFGVSYHEATPNRPAYRLFPVEKLEIVTNLLKYWFEEANPVDKGGCVNRNGGKRLAVRVGEQAAEVR